MSKTTLITMLLMTLFIATSCKEVSVGLNDDAQDALDCIASIDDCGDSDSDNPNDGNDNDDDDGDAGQGNDGRGNSGDDDSGGANLGDSSGGVEVLPTSRKGANRFFMGTYEVNEYSYNDCGDEWGNGYDLPGVIRLYSHGNTIDFEDNFGNLRWIGNVYPDDTFDFSMQFLDSFGNRSNIVACTCYIEEPYSYSYDSDTMKCTCDPTAPYDETCSITYDMM